MRWWWVAILVVVVAIVAYIFWPAAPITNYPSSGTDIVAFGDSLVYGTGSSSGGFIKLAADKLHAPIVNLGVPGDTTAQGLVRIGELDQYHPKVVLLLLGGNDYLRRVPQAQTLENLSKLIENIQSRGAVVLLLGVRGGLLQDNFAPMYEDLAKKYHTAYVPDVLDGLLGNQTLMSDEVHPNDAGYALIASRVAPVLQKLLH